MEYKKVVVVSKHFLESDDRKAVMSYIDSLELSFPWGIKFEIGVPHIEVYGEPELASALTEKFLSALHGVK
jgi:hypothetical protein